VTHHLLSAARLAATPMSQLDQFLPERRKAAKATAAATN